MKKILAASRREEILKRKSEYDRLQQEWTDRQEERESRFRKDEAAALAPIQEELEKGLGRFSALEFNIRVDSWYRDGVRVNIQCNEYTKFDEDVALSWSYEAHIGKDGEVERETSSWSGMKATTEKQLKSLRQTVSALEYLNDIDWKALLSVKLPRYSDYYDAEDRAPEKQDFRKELLEADLQDLIGTNKIVKVHNFESSGWRGDLWLKILRETPSQYEVTVIPNYAVSNGTENSYLGDRMYTQRVRKINVKPYYEGDEVVVKEINS